MSKNKLSFSTLLIHSGEKPDSVTGAIAPILVRTKTYKQPKFGKVANWQYSRAKNPTRNILEEKLADLEGGGFATVFSSGNAATANFLLTLNPGDHIIFCQEVYGGTYRLVTQLFNKFGINFDFVDFSDFKKVEKAVTPQTKYFFIETPTNPSLHVIDLKKVSQLSKKLKIPFVVDGTFSPPCSTKAFDYGAEVIIHSLSKYCAGHNDVIAGAVITKNKNLYEKLTFLQRTVGAILSPDECYRVIQGIKTLELRWRRVSQSVLEIAKFLANNKKINKVFYPGLKNHPNYKIAIKQNRNGFGAVVSFELQKSDFSKIKKFVEAVTKDDIIIYGESLASPETILAYPRLMSHSSLSQEDRDSLGISDYFFRLSVGFEDPKDIIENLKDGIGVL